MILARGADSRYLHVAVNTPRACLFLAALALAGCDESAAASPPDAAPTPPKPSATVAPSGTARPGTTVHPGATASPSAGDLKVLKIVFASAVKNKEPADTLDKAEAGQRVYAHVTLRNKTDGAKPITLAFLVGGAVRTKIDLTVEQSFSYRTWGYVTLRDSDKGELVTEVRDASGTVMERAKIAIKPR